MVAVDWVELYAELRSESPQSAWETLLAREIIPMEWVDDPKRRFMQTFRSTCNGCDGFGTASLGNSCRTCDGIGWVDRGNKLPHPITVKECLFAASHITHMITAEELAYECARHVDAKAHRVVWILQGSLFGTRGLPVWMWNRIHQNESIGMMLYHLSCAPINITDEEIVMTTYTR